MIIVLIVIALAVIFVLMPKNKAKQKEEAAKKKEIVEKSEAEKIQELLEKLPENLQEMYAWATDPSVRTMPVLFALVTCQHCIRTQKFLKENAIDYKLIHVDLYDSVLRKSIMDKLKEYNERGSFPTFIMPSGKTVVGFREHLLREAINNEPK